MDLSGKRVLVIGASSGIGRGTALLLTELGARVALSGRDVPRLEGTLAMLAGQGHSVEPFDLDQLDAIPAWIRDVAQKGGPFHGLVHSSGLHSPAPLKILTFAKLETLMLRVNVYSAALALRGLRQRGCCAPEGSSAVLLSSAAAMKGEAAISGYSGTKAAVIAMARSLAVELAPERIRVNAVAPGVVETEMSAKIRASLTDEQYKAIVGRHLLGIGTVRDVANAVAFLLADCSRWITGPH